MAKAETSRAPDAAGQAKPDLLAMYRMMALIRAFEEQVQTLSQGGLVPGRRSA